MSEVVEEGVLFCRIRAASRVSQWSRFLNGVGGSRGAFGERVSWWDGVESSGTALVTFQFAVKNNVIAFN